MIRDYGFGFSEPQMFRSALNASFNGPCKLQRARNSWVGMTLLAAYVACFSCVICSDEQLLNQLHCHHGMTCISLAFA